MLNTRIEKNLTLGVRENFWAKQSRNKRRKKNFLIFLDSAPVLEHEQIGFCWILENNSSFRMRKMSSN